MYKNVYSYGQICTRSILFPSSVTKLNHALSVYLVNSWERWVDRDSNPKFNQTRIVEFAKIYWKEIKTSN